MDTHIDLESVASVARKAERIADAMPQAIRELSQAADGAASGNEGSQVAQALQAGCREFGEAYELLTRQLEGFASDLRTCVDVWAETEGTNTEMFARYGDAL